MRVLTIVVIPLLIIAGAAFGAYTLVNSRAPAKREAKPVAAPSVEVVALSPVDVAAPVFSTGIVVPAREVTINSEVSGRIVWQSAALVEGGLIKQGESLVRVDRRDYDLALEQEKSRIEQAKLNFDLELSRQNIAKREWELLGDNRPEEQAALALRKPQLANAKSQLEAAESGHRRAELALERTTVRAPFNAFVKKESVEVGQLLSPNVAVATLVGTDALIVEVSLSLEQLPYVVFDDLGDGGSLVRIVQRLGHHQGIVREGRMKRLAGRIEVDTRTAAVLVEVKDPFEPSSLLSSSPVVSSNAELVQNVDVPLLPGAFVDVEIAGKTLPSVFSLPREAVHEGDSVWVVDEKNELQKRILDVVWRTPTTILARSGIEPGSRVVVSALALPIVGMTVKPLDSPVGVVGAAQ